MAIYEIIFEDGSYSKADYGSNEEALQACQAHHERAIKGMPSLEGTNVPSTRVVKIFRYDSDPGDIYENQTMSDDMVKKYLDAIVKAATENGVTDLRQVAAAIRDLSNPMQDSEPHESNYKAKEAEELTLPWVG